MATAKTFALGPFVLDRVAGRGGMGTIWRGTVAGRSVPVAVKVLHPQRAGGATYLEAFRREVRAMARLSHPGVVDVYDDGEITAEEAVQHPAELSAGSPYFVMAWADAGTLTDGLGLRAAAGRRRASFATMRAALLQVLDALAHAHARGVIHRDLKPDNVLAFSSPEGLRYKLADFGVAHALGEAGEARVAGTPHYMAPEQFRGAWRDFGPWTDLYALGAVVFELLTGRRPFAASGLFGLMKAHTELAPPALPPEVDAPLGMSAWLQWLLAKRPEARPSCAADAAAALMDLGPAPGPVGTPSTAPRAETVAVTVLEPCLREAVSTAITAVDTAPLANLLEGVSAPEVAEPPTLWRRRTPENWRSAVALEAKPGPLRGMGMSLVELRDPELVGREEERDVLWAQLHAVVTERRAAGVVIRGAAGMGKSRLARWLGERAHELGVAAALRARPHPGDPSGGLGLIASHLRADGLEGDELAARLGRLPALSPYEVSRMVRSLAPAGGDEGREPMNAAEIRGSTHRVLHHAASRRPLVVWFDDAHLQEETLVLGRHLLRMQAAQPHPTLLVWTVQDESLAERPLAMTLVHALTERDDVMSLRLGPLDVRDQRVLLASRLGLATDVIDVLAERTEGNPLFAAQLVEDWVRRDLLEPRTTGYGLRDDASLSLPDDLFELWRARVERWLATRAEPDRAALELLAIGGDVSEASWRAVCHIAGVVVAARFVDDLVAQRLAEVGPTGVQLVHGMLRESLVREAERAGRDVAHHRAWVAWWRKRVAHEPLGAAELGRHLVAAGEREAAVEHLLAGATLLGDRGAFAAADQVIIAWRQTLRDLGAEENDPRWSAGLVLEARHASLRGQDERAERAVQRALDHAHDEASLADALLAAAQVAERQGRRQDAQSRYRAAYERFDALDNDLGRGRASIGLGTVAAYLHDLDAARAHHADAMRRLGAAGAELELARAERQLGNAILPGAPARARELYRRALARFEAAEAEVDQHKALNGIAESFRLEGDLDEALAQFHALLERQELCAATHDQDLTRFNIALTLIAAGRYREAEGTLAQVASALEERPHEVLQVGLVFCAIPCAAVRGAWVRFDAGMRRAEAELQREGLVEHDDAVNLRLAGDLAAAAGEPGRARAAYVLAQRIWGDAEPETADVAARIAALPTREDD